MGKKDDDKLAGIVEDLIADAKDDRSRLVDFIDKLLAEHADQPAGIAEYVAKLMDATTRQHQVRVAMLKALRPKGPSDDSEDEHDAISAEIGLPFEEEVEGDAN